ncbi:MAG: hypothetical protein NT169_14375 [Chloroflexi bacterium]|nr:hypothetical protein [Chloroflexota bacterium]
MTYREMALGIGQLPLNERLMLLEEFRIDLTTTPKPVIRRAPKLVCGMLKPKGLAPSDRELREDYEDYLIEKYL